MSEFTKDLDPISAAIVMHGGLFAYNRARMAGNTTPPALTTAKRPMTLCEKILRQPRHRGRQDGSPRRACREAEYFSSRGPTFASATST